MLSLAQNLGRQGAFIPAPLFAAGMENFTALVQHIEMMGLPTDSGGRQAELFTSLNTVEVLYYFRAQVVSSMAQVSPTEHDCDAPG